ncbi:aromatic acid exporter family protein [Variovorax sp. Sphag1AA]|uniref:FUSC family protein n=1 Tax=Variovorax sp. Sphag1AA TaxID=2587027 RepID=UPI001610201E|nr:FUSC family protein [Variovorax sp. Sphag1AA]MBB3180870.1 putative membrane protein YccC [Variovorax sp. Sphag1AA]
MSQLPASAEAAALESARWWRRPEARHGGQLVAAVLLSYGASAAMGLPESLWAVMSAVIVVRPTIGSSLGVGWQRVQGTVLGALLALVGVWLHQHGMNSAVATVGVVGALAYGSAMLPALRSAPIAALIVLGGAAVAGHSALQIALLRVLEISVGVGVGLLISLTDGSARAAARFDEECSAILRRLANDTGMLIFEDIRPSAKREAASDAARAALRELAVLAEGADREMRWRQFWERRTQTPPARPHRTAARLLARLSHDVGLFDRLAGGPSNEPERCELVEALKHALVSTADQIAGLGAQDLQPLKRCASQAAWTAVAVKLLSQDLIGLARMRVR